ncbi:MAG: M23 family metallopeptidase [Fusobacteria bacterium]|nr:M23 family metallopeptidase [Fusobacteriota bacterium]
MKKLTIFVFLIMILEINAIIISKIPESINQGDFFIIELVNRSEITNYEIETDIARTDIKIFENNDKIYSLIPVNYYVEPGKYIVNIKYKEDNLDKNSEFFINIIGKESVKDSLKVKEETAKKNSDENKKEMRSAVTLVRKNTIPEKLWDDKFLMPVEGRISTGFALERYVNGKSNGKHSGIDISAKKGTPIKSVNNGKIVYSAFLKVTGNTVIIDHGMNLFSSYSHLDTVNIKVGDIMKKGDIIGTVGDTGFSTAPHLHFTFTIGDTFINPFLLIDKIIIN